MLLILTGCGSSTEPILEPNTCSTDTIPILEPNICSTDTVIYNITTENVTQNETLYPLK